MQCVAPSEVFTTIVVHLLHDGFEGGCPPAGEADKIVIATTVAFSDKEPEHWRTVDRDRNHMLYSQLATA